VSALTAGGVGFTMGIYSNFLRSAGLDEFWVNMVNVCFFVTITVCEIPTGLFADIFGRKGSFVISCFLEAVSFLIYGFSKSFLGFVTAEVTLAIGATFASGALSAWLVDSLKHVGEKHDLLKIFSTRSLISRILIIGTSFIGGYIGDRGLNLPFFVASSFYFVCGIITVIFMKEIYFEKTKFSFLSGLKEMKKTLERSFAFTKSDTNFRFILIISFIQMFAVMAPNMEWQKIFSNLGFTNSTNGTIASFISVTMILGALLTRKMGVFAKNEMKSIMLMQIFVGVSIALTVSFVGIYPTLLFFFLHELGRGMSGPLMESFTQNSITSPKERATLSSFLSMVGHFGGALGLVVSGLVARYAGIPTTWVVSGSFLIITTFIVAKKYRKESS
jgi:MFS family permease